MGKRLSTTLLGILMLLLASLLIAPAVIGMGVRDATIRSVIELFPPEASQQLVFTESRFNGGWFSSDGELEIQYAPLGMSGQITVQVTYATKHGPLLNTPAGWRIGLAYARLDPVINDAEFSAALEDVPFEPPQVYLELLARLDQSLQIDLTVTPVSYQGSEGEFIFEGITARLLSYADQSADFEFTMGNFLASESGGQLGFRIGGMEMQSHSEQLNDLLAPATARLAMNELQSYGPFPFSVAAITATSQLTPSTVGGERIDIIQDIAIRDVGSELPLQSMTLRSEVLELQSQLIRSYYELLNEFQTQLNNGNTSLNNDFSALGQELGLILLRNRLVFLNAAEATLYQGNHSANLDVRWAGIPGLGSMQELDIPAIVSALNIELSISLDLDAVMRSPSAQMVDPYVQQGYIEIDNGRVQLNASLQDSELRLNNEVIPLDQFINL